MSMPGSTPAAQPPQPAPGQERATYPASGAMPIAGGTTGAGLKWAWAAFSRNLGAFLGPAAVYLLVGIIAFVAYMIVTIQQVLQDPSAAEQLTAQQGQVTVTSVLVALVSSAIGALWTSGALHAGSIVMQGRKPSFKDGLIGPFRVIALAFLISVVAQLGSGFWVIPAIVVGLLFYFATPEAARGNSFGGALAASPGLVFKNFGTVIVTGLLAIAIALTAVLILPIVVIVPVLNLLVLGVHHRVTEGTLLEPV